MSDANYNIDAQNSNIGVIGDHAILQEILKNVQAGGNITVKDIIQIGTLSINLDQVPKPTGFPQNIPRSNTDKFVGREKELVDIHNHLQQNNSAVIAAVQGMAGIGKTELATQYSLLHLQLNSYPAGICWLRARDENVGLQIIQFCRTSLDLKPPDDINDLLEKVRWCWQHWTQGNTLVVFDDVQNYREIQPYLPPQASQFKVLITTRLKLNLPGSLSLEILSESEALELLAQLIGLDRLNQELEKAKELCQRLGYLPLALQLVGLYIKELRISLAEMLKRLEAKGLAHPALIVDINDPTWTLSIERGVEAAFELSWEEISPAAQELGCLLSLFALSPIPWSLVESASPGQETEYLEKAGVELKRLHLLQGENNYQLHQLHQLIREFLKTKHNQSSGAKEQKSHFCQAMVKVAQSVPESPTQHQIKAVENAIPHLSEVAENLIDAVSDENLDWPFIGIGRYYIGQGLYKLAEPWYKQCVSLLEIRLGEEHPSVATSYNNLAVIYYFQGRYSEAEQLYQQELALSKKLLGEEHPSVATSYNNLAALYYNQGRYSEAEPLYQQALALRQKLLGEDHPSVASSFNNLAELYRVQRRYSEAEPLYQQALALSKKLLGEEHPDVARSYNNLALLFSSQKRYSEAEPLYQQALALSKKLLGEDHLNVAFSYNNLAELYYFQGKYSEAEPLFQQALALWQKFLGEDHPSVATSYSNLAYLYYAQRRYSEAELLYQQALALRQKLLGEEHPDVATSFNSLALFYYNQGRYSEAKPLLQQALALWQKLLGEDHPYVATSYHNLANLYSSQGRYSEAEPLYQQALALWQKLLGEDHPSVASSYNNLALLYFSQGRYSEAEPLYQKALALRQKLLGEDHPDVASSYNNLAVLYDSQGRYSEAEPLYQKAVDIATRTLGENHPNTITIRESLELLRNQLS